MRDDVSASADRSSAGTATRRIATLDILRGLALFGMILVHFHQRFRLTTELQSFFGEEYIGWFVWMGVEQKAWATFAFLFGVGFAILMRRAEAKGLPVVPLYLRRMAVLAVIGGIIFLLTDFQMLTEYAIWGAVLLFLRQRSTRALLIIAVVAAATPSLIRLGQGLYELYTIGRAGADAAWEARQAAAPAALEAHSYAQVVMHRLQSFPSYLAGLWIPGASFPLFLIGLLAVRHRVFDEPERYVTLIGRAMAFGLASWLAFWLLLPQIPTDFSSMRVALPIRYGLGVISDQWLAFTYIGALTLLLTWRPRWTSRLALFGTVGRIALTNYVLQCLVLEYLSSPFGLNLKLRPYYYALGAVVLFAVQVVISRLWLSRFRYGPLEWLWRSATYMRWQPMRLRGTEPGTLVVTGS
ncbi:MAG TPA: DUF418 domain-containing protein [Gemmatimonadaceae bacterium]|nr:DUF418 domain-containing protein [Gemmatimonadaceae bacterium]